MSRIFWDTNLFIYLFEGADEQAEARCKASQANDRAARPITHVHTHAWRASCETSRCGAHGSGGARYTQAMETAAAILSFDQAAARAFAEIRRDRSIRPPDAIQLACAAAAGTDLFLTNDRRLAP